MDSPSMLEISDHRDGKTVDSADFLTHRKHIQQRLGGMLSGSVSGVDQRTTRTGCSSLILQRKIISTTRD